MSPVSWLALLTIGPNAQASRVAIGMSGATGFSLAEPTFERDRARPAGVLCGGLTGWYLSGSTEGYGPDGEVRRTADDTRVGGEAMLCPAAGGGRSGNIGAGYGWQWGSILYVTAHGTAGLSIYGKRGAGDARYAAYAPYIKPAFGVGLSLPPGVTAEISGYMVIAPPVVQDITAARPAGIHLGHLGLELSLLVGSASPVAPR